MSTKKIIIAGSALVVVTGILLWYFKHKKALAAAQAVSTLSPSSTAPASSGITATTAPDTGSPAKNALLSAYAGQPKQTAAINSADAQTLRLWSLVYSMWSAGWPSAKIYATALDGTSTASSYDNSIGKWWELFSQRNGF